MDMPANPPILKRTVMSFCLECDRKCIEEEQLKCQGCQTYMCTTCAVSVGDNVYYCEGCSKTRSALKCPICSWSGDSQCDCAVQFPDLLPALVSSTPRKTS